MDDSDRKCLDEPFWPIYNPFRTKPILVKQRNDYEEIVLTETPIWSSLLFDNTTSDARDHCANERTYLSWLRLGTYMAITSVAIVTSFHLKHAPTQLELRMALPFGIIFWLLSLACLISGFANYCKTVIMYSRRSAIVQSGWKTELVFSVAATAIIIACIIFISTNANTKNSWHGLCRH